MTDKFRNRYRISTSRARWWDYGNGSYFVTICTRNRIHFFGEIIDGEMYKSKIGDIAEFHWKEIPDRFPYAKLGAFVIMPNHVHGIVNIRRPYKFRGVETLTIDFPDVASDSNGFPDVESDSNDFRDVESDSNDFRDVESDSNDFPDVESDSNDFRDVESDSNDFPDVESDSNDFRDVETRLIASLHPENVDHHPENAENQTENISKSHRGGITGIHNPMLHQNLSRVIRWYTGRVSYESHKINPGFNWQRRFNDRIIRDSEEYKIKTQYIQQNPLNWKEDEFYG